MKKSLIFLMSFVFLFAGNLTSIYGQENAAGTNVDTGSETDAAMGKIKDSKAAKGMQKSAVKMENKAKKLEKKAKDKMAKDENEPSTTDKVKTKGQAFKAKVVNAKAKAKAMAQPKPEDKNKPSMADQAKAKVDMKKANVKNKAADFGAKAKAKENSLKGELTK